jgi:hypothetical protein
MLSMIEVVIAARELADDLAMGFVRLQGAE